jgi:tetratricopeptide (TPR) repeat protein
MKSLKYITLLAIVLGLASCEKSLTFYQDDDRFVLEEDALLSPDDVQELLNSIYDVEANFLGGQMQNLGELLADGLTSPAGRNDDYTQVFNRNTDFFNGTIDGVYRDAYIAIYRANTLIEKVNDVPGVTPDFSQRVIAESQFIRALNHYLVVRLFAQPFDPNTSNTQLGIIIKTTTDYTPLPRNTVAEVYNTVLADLRSAKNGLPETNDIYANSWAAKALLAKVHFEMGNTDSAYFYANEVIANSPYQLDNLDRFEHGTSTESLFRVVSTPSINDRRGGGFSGNYRTDQPSQPTLQISPSLYTSVSVDTADLRFKKWFEVVNPGASNQFYGTPKFNWEYLDVPVLHLTEMVLIKAECAYEKGSYAEAVSELNKLRARANVTLYDANLFGAPVYNAVQFERTLEMCFEGDRVFQLKRQGVQGRIQRIRDVPYNCPGMVLQFPNSEGTGAGFVFNPSGGCN